MQSIWYAAPLNNVVIFVSRMVEFIAFMCFMIGLAITNDTIII